MTKGPAQPTGQDKKLQEGLREKGEIPQHIAIIMDGNGRWAKSRTLPRVAGHNEGVNSVRDIVEACGQLGVRFLTIYAFSTENWRRPKDEVSVLMRLLLKVLHDERDRLYRNNVRLKSIGDLAALPKDIQSELQEAMELMKHNTGLTLVLALSYSGRWDIANAMRLIAREVEAGKIKPEQIDDKVVAYYLSTKGIPDPDLLIRTSGEMRVSNFLLWQLAYTEFYITDLLWPAFRRRALYDAIASFQQRERRFGMVSEQLQSKRKHAAVSYVERLLKSVSGN